MTLTLKTVPFGLASALFLITSASAQSPSAQDRKFMEDAAKAGMSEIHMGQLALEHASSSAVKSYAQRLIDDHTKANEELTALAKQKSVTLPADNSNMMAKGLDKKNGTDFDQAFTKMAVEDHQKVIKEFEKEASSGSDPDIKSWASKMLPSLRAHLDAAKSLKS